MKTYVALFRGINVGGNNVLPMKELVVLLENLGARNVRTYIQSGNAVFQSGKGASLLSDEIGGAVERGHGFKPRVLVREAEQIKRAVEGNPFPEAESEPKTLHLYLLASVPERPDLAAMQEIKTAGERFVLGEGVLYLHTPDGLGRSKLAANAEKLLGVPATARNWRTVNKVLAMAEQHG